jgi:23S rRNA (cytidine1920-2'-O)/16S rRNA (cytidine1409-2'-O)-methyltransferase
MQPAPTLVTADLSFIGLGKVLPHVLPLTAEQADAVVLVKPQFEAGPQRVGRGGLVAPEVAEAVAAEVRSQLDGLAGFAAQALIESPVTGGDGNREYLLWLSRGGA